MKKLILMFLWCCAATLAGQTSYTFQPAGGDGKDALIKSNNPTTAFTTSANIGASSSGGNRIRGLLKFDIATIPANAIITSAQLSLSGIGHTGTNASYLRKNTGQWDAGNVTWNTAPATTTVSQISLSQSTSSLQVYVIDVKDFVQEMVSIPAANFGWTIQLKDESVTGLLNFGSADNATASLRPKLVVTYCMPVNVKAVMNPSTGPSNGDGSLSLIVSGGVVPYTYLWSDASVTKDLSGKLPGVYSVIVSDNAGNTFKKNFCIVPQNSPFTFTISPDALSGKDAIIQTGDDGTNSDKNGRNAIQYTSQRVSAGIWGKARSLLGIDLSCIPAGAVVSNATLRLAGNGHNPLSRSNESYLYKNTADWNDRTLTWNTQPSHITDGGIYLPGTSTANENAAIDVTSHVQGWINDPSSNFGWKLMLADELTASYTIRSYGSSNHSNPALWPAIEVTLTLPWLSDNQRNWVMEESYDENGVVISTQKTYLDDLGRPTQSLNQDAAGEVFATQTVYDAYGRPAVQTLPAYHGTALQYNTNFFQDQNNHEYSYINFDLNGKIVNPDLPQSGLATAAPTYYSNANTMDAWQATATLPFARTHYMANPMDEIKTVNPADDAFNTATGRESRSYSMVCGDELKFIFGANTSYKVQTNSGNPMASTSLTLAPGYFIRATKQVVVSPDNKEVVSYTIGDKVLASCMSGLPSPDNCSMSSIRNYMDWYGTQSIDIHVPHSAKSSLSFPLPTYKFGPNTFTVSASDISYVITDQSTEQVLTPGVDYTINSSTRVLSFDLNYLAAHAMQPLFLRIRTVYNPTFAAGLPPIGVSVPAGIVQYDLDYGRWSVNYYDLGGNLRTSVSAKGIDCSSPGTVSMATTYDYSHLGQLIAQKSPDEGLKEYIYNTDGQLRYSQNAEQKNGKRFSYIAYDAQNRPLESGEFSNVSGSGSNGVYFQNYYNDYTAPYAGNISSNTLVNSTTAFSGVYTNDVTHSSYEELNSTDDIPSGYTYASSYAGKYKNGQLSKTWTKNTSTWYKYDPAGRMIATVQQLNDPDFITQAGSGDARIKTTDIDYDPFYGQVLRTYYQKHISNEYAEHQFTYDVYRRLTGVSFVAGAGNSPVAVEALSYDKLGRVSRRVLGPGLQGLDYVYTLSGQLKALNHPSLDYTKDRGGDNRSYSGSGSGVYADLFGELLEYYPGDYTRNGTSIEAHGNGVYKGRIHGMRYKTRNDINGTINGVDYIDYAGASQVQLITATNYGQQELAKRYTYDAFGQLASSTFGTFNNNSNTFTARTDYKECGATTPDIGYDANGNITNLLRNSYDVGGAAKNLDKLTYYYVANSNKLEKVYDLAANSFPSSFNFKNQAWLSPATIGYNAIGQMTVNADENVVVMQYDPNGQPAFVQFANGNTNSYYYNDQGKKYKAVFYDAAGTGTYKYTWYIGSAIYEYLSNVASFDLKELSVGGAGRVGVYKQDVAGIAIGSGHIEYQLADHLGNVRVTFKQASGGGIEAMSVADYYAFGGQMPGRIWQQSGGDYRYGYQGQEKATQPDANWDEFELRLYNHDLGRWSAPDPYGQFHSPYIAMGNNPVSMVDPDGGYINQSSAGQAARAQFLNQQAWDRTYQRNRYSYEFLYNNYKSAVEDLYRDHFYSINKDFNDYNFLEDLYKLNNEYMGLGLGNMYMSSGMDYVSQNTLYSDYGRSLMWGLTNQNGTSATMVGIAASIPGANAWTRMTPGERAASGYAVSIDRYDHYVNGQLAGSYKTMEGAITAAQNVFEAWMEDTQVEYTDESPMYASADGNPGSPVTRTTTLKDYLTNHGGAGKAIGFELAVSGNAHASFSGVNFSFSIVSLMQLGGTYGGYFYTYGNYQGGGQIGYGAYSGVSFGGNAILGINNDRDLDPNNVTGPYGFASHSAAVGAELGAGVGWGYASSSWDLWTVGGGIGIGTGAEYSHQFGQGITLKAYDAAIPTQNRSYWDIITNHVSYGNSNIWKGWYNMINR